MLSVETRRNGKKALCGSLILLLTACSFKGVSKIMPNQIPTPTTPEFKQNTCEGTPPPSSKGKLFHQVVNWGDTGKHKVKGSIQELYDVYKIVDENGVIRERESGEVWGFCWVIGPNGERLYFDDPLQFTPNPITTPTP